MKRHRAAFGALATLSLGLLVAGCGNSDGAGSTSASRSAAAGATAIPLPTAAFITTAEIGSTKGNGRLIRCDLPAGPCRQLGSLGPDASETSYATYASGRVYVKTRKAPSGQTRVVSCDGSGAEPCATVLGPVANNRTSIVGPVWRSGRLIVGYYDFDGATAGMFACDPARTTSIKDCERLPITPRFTSLAMLGADQVVGAVGGGYSSAPRDIVACRIDDGACRALGTVPGAVRSLLYVPAIGRPTEFVPEVPRVYVGVPWRNQMWSCGVAGGSGCTRLNPFAPNAMTAIGDWVYAGGDKSIQQCKPDVMNACTTFASQDDVSQLLPYGNDLLVGTYSFDTSTLTGSSSGSLLVRPGAGGAPTTIWNNQPGGVQSLALLQDPVLTTRVERYTPSGSSVRAYGTVTLDPPPAAGAAECALVRAELPVTCRSQYADGQTVTLTATPGPNSRLNTWLGDAEKCNEAGGPGTPPAATCTITVTGQTTLAIAGFRPA